jgi:hypothetical protein
VWNRDRYLTEDDAVAGFVIYLAKVITGEITVGEFWPDFDRKFSLERPHPEWRLEDLCRHYTWNGSSLAETTARLRPLRRFLRSALVNDVPATQLTDLIKRVFDWGWIDAAHDRTINGRWSKGKRSSRFFGQRRPS